MIFASLFYTEDLPTKKKKKNGWNIIYANILYHLLVESYTLWL